MTEQSRTAPPTVYVTELNMVDGAGWIHVFIDLDAAVAKLIELAGNIGIEVIDYSDAGSETLDEHPDIRDYAVMSLPVEGEKK